MEYVRNMLLFCGLNIAYYKNKNERWSSAVKGLKEGIGLADVLYQMSFSMAVKK